jgi:hypothetical protein
MWKRGKQVTVRECAYPSSGVGNFVTARDHGDSHGRRDIPECGSVEMFLQKNVNRPWIFVKSINSECRARANTGCLEYERNSEIRVIRERCSVGMNVRVGGSDRSSRVDMTHTESSETMKQRNEQCMSTNVTQCQGKMWKVSTACWQHRRYIIPQAVNTV